jgi:DNA-binding transcriptional LysR family regulator
MPMLFELSQTYSMLTFDISFSNRITDLVENGIDLAVRIGQVGGGADLVARRLGTQNIVICAAPDYLARRGTPQQISDLGGHDCITYSRADGPAPWLMADETGLVRQTDVSGSFSIGNYEAILDCVLRGSGIAQLPEWLIADALNEGSAMPVMAAFNPPGLPIQAVWPHRRDMNPRTRVLIDLLVSHFRRFSVELPIVAAPVRQ